MGQSKLRIPRVATAVMVLGGLSCDDGGGGGGSAGRNAGSNTSNNAGSDGGVVEASSSRITKVAQQTCKLELSCEDGPFAGDSDGEENKKFATQQECVDAFVAAISRDLAGLSKPCGDAYLAYYECYIAQGCEPDKGKCAKLYARVEELCEGQLDDDDE